MNIVRFPVIRTITHTLLYLCISSLLCGALLAGCRKDGASAAGLLPSADKTAAPALEAAYGARHYFGGGGAFGKAKETICSDYRASAKQTAQTLAELIIRHLDFIKDSHFTVNGGRLHDINIPYLYTETAFLKTGKGYTAADSGKTVDSVEGYSDQDSLFRLSVSPQGKAVYYPLIQTGMQDSFPQNLRIRYKDGTAQTLYASEWNSYYDTSGRTLDLHYNQGIPVIFVRNMGFDKAWNDKIGKQFLSYAKKLKDEPVLIIDLRSNGGGNNILPLKWLASYTGKPVATNYVSIMYWTEQDMIQSYRDIFSPYHNSRNDFLQIAGMNPISDNYMKAYAQPDSFIKNERLLIILTGKNTMSAAETFVDAAHNVQNTLIIGQNTFGMLRSNAYIVIYLPHSGTAVQFGCNLTIMPGNYFEEFSGFEPDLWTDGDAEERAVALVLQYSN